MINFESAKYGYDGLVYKQSFIIKFLELCTRKNNIKKKTFVRDRKSCRPIYELKNDQP